MTILSPTHSIEALTDQVTCLALCCSSFYSDFFEYVLYMPERYWMSLHVNRA